MNISPLAVVTASTDSEIVRKAREKPQNRYAAVESSKHLYLEDGLGFFKLCNGCHTRNDETAWDSSAGGTIRRRYIAAACKMRTNFVLFTFPWLAITSSNTRTR